MKREFKGVWIPAEIWCNRDLSWPEKVMLREIDSLSLNDQGGCYASNGYFAEFFQLSKSRVSEIVSSLTKKGYVKTYIVRHTEGGGISSKRLIRPTGKGLRKTEPPYSEKRKGYSEKRKGYSENSEYNNSGINKNKGFSTSFKTTDQCREELGGLLKRISGVVSFPEKRNQGAGSKPGGTPGEAGGN